MKANAFLILFMTLGLVLMATPLVAHHSFMVGFDLSKPIVVKGVVTKVAWANPHISFYVDVAGPDGKVTNWGIDAAAPSALAARGWTSASMKAGDVVTVEGFLARNGKPFAAASTVTLGDGRKILAGSDGAYAK